MKTLPIYTYGSDILRKKTKRVTRVDDKLVSLVRDMFHTMHKANGVGLAATQIGLDVALTVVDISRMEGEEKQEPLTLINPRILEIHGDQIQEEGCLSIPHLRASVQRAKEIYVEYQDLDLNKKMLEAKDFLARVIQHEIDHLNGVLFIDHLTKEERSKMKSDLNEIKKGLVMTDYVLADIPARNKKTISKKILSSVK